MDRADVPATINMTNRKVLALLHELLARVPNDGDDADHHRKMVEALDNGYAGEYSNVFAAVQPELSRTECELVWDILDMFRIVHASVAKLSKAERASLGEHADLALEFAGFDLNDSLEGRMPYYVRYLISAERWEEFAPYFDAKHDRGNSHHATLASYKRMLAVYKPIFFRASPKARREWHSPRCRRVAARRRRLAIPRQLIRWPVAVRCSSGAVVSL